MAGQLITMKEWFVLFATVGRLGRRNEAAAGMDLHHGLLSDAELQQVTGGLATPWLVDNE